MLKGSMPALITPFKDGAVDLDTLKKLVDWHIDQGSHGLVPVGTTGESPTLTHNEHELVVKTVVTAAAGRVRTTCPPSWYVSCAAPSQSCNSICTTPSWAARSPSR